MQELILTISITIQIPETPMPASAKKPEPVLAKEQPPVAYIFLTGAVWPA